MIGMHREAGGALDGIDHLRQSIRDLLTTRIGTRVWRRDYGSELPALVDAPIGGETVVDLIAATAEAVIRWEPRLAVDRIAVLSAGPGRIEIALDGVYRPDGRPILIDGIVIA